MAEDTRLSVLVDPPLAEPPTLDELQRRGKAWRRRTGASRGGLVAAVAAVLISAGVALTPGDAPETLQTAAPAGSASTTVSGSPAAEPAPAAVAVRTFDVDGQQWTLLATRTADTAICFTLRPVAGEALNPGCLTPDGRAVQAGAADLKSVSFLYGIVAPGVTQVTLTAGGNATRLDVLGSGTGFPVTFIGTVVPPSVTSAELAATRNGSEERVAVPLPSHLRVSSGSGREVPPSPSSTTVTTARPTPTQPPPTPAPDTPVSTVVPPTAPPTTVAPGLGQPKRVQPVPGATDLRKQTFQSAAAAGAQSLAVRFWSGVEPCYVLGRVDVTETAERVTVTLWTGSGPGSAGMACIQMAAYYEVVVQLQAPLGTRTVIDGAA
jgi:hypothetical protein